jgi:hypothetical protein
LELWGKATLVVRLLVLRIGKQGVEAAVKTQQVRTEAVALATLVAVVQVRLGLTASLTQAVAGRARLRVLLDIEHREGLAVAVLALLGT